MSKSNQLPTEEDLQKLSRRGMVCYAVRCAMRVMDLTKPHPELHEKSVTCIKAATRVCLEPYGGFLAIAGSDALVAYNAANVSAGAARAAAGAARAAAGAARAAAAAAAKRTDAARTARTASAAADAYVADRVAYANAIAAAYDGAIDWNTLRAPDVAFATIRDAIKADYAKLLTLTGHQAGELGDPIDPSEKGPLGPLWPEEVKDEKQELLKAIEKSNPEPMIGVYFDESAGLSVEDKVLFLNYLNALYKLHGGIGLKIIREKQFEYEVVTEVVPCL